MIESLMNHFGENDPNRLSENWFAYVFGENMGSDLFGLWCYLDSKNQEILINYLERKLKGK